MGREVSEQRSVEHSAQYASPSCSFQTALATKSAISNTLAVTTGVAPLDRGNCRRNSEANFSRIAVISFEQLREGVSRLASGCIGRVKDELCSAIDHGHHDLNL